MNDRKQRHQAGSYFGPILLIALGLIFLVHNLGILPGSGWDTFLKLWPALLIIAGLDDLLRGEGVVWPALLIAAGTFLLLNNFGPRSWISWSQLLKLWPVILIALGIDLILGSGVRRRAGWSTAAGAVLTLLLVAGAVWWIGTDGGWGRTAAETFQIGEEQSYESGRADFSLNAGQLLVSALDREDLFAAGTVPGDAVNFEQQLRGESISFRMKSRDVVFFTTGAKWEVGLQPEVPLELAVDNGAGQLFLALENLMVADLEVQQGAGEIVVRLPAQDDQEIRIDQAVGRIRIVIPAGLGLRLETERAVSTLDVPDDFSRSGTAYLTPGYEQAEHQAELRIEQAVGLVEISYAR